jgi:predicted AlkP superfamily phosphohydrolase/phosphomutase
VTDGGFRPDATFVPMPLHDVATLTEAFRRAVLRLFVRRGLLEEETALGMLAWPHSGFHVHDGVWVPAYALGLTGLFLNVRGREGQGIVAPGAEAAALKVELMGRLTGLLDGEAGVVAIREAFDPARLYRGPYLENAPDLLIGYDHGYRVSWNCATGVVAGLVFEDNPKAWSGDHCVDPRLVPGVLFCNRAIQAPDPALVDIAPTALWLFGLEPPAHMDGKVLFRDAV